MNDGNDITDKEPDFFFGFVPKIGTGGAKKNANGAVDYQSAPNGKGPAVVMPKSVSSSGNFSCADAAVSLNWGCSSYLTPGYWFGCSYSGKGPAVVLVCRKSCKWACPMCADVDSCRGGQNNYHAKATCQHAVVHKGPRRELTTAKTRTRARV